MVAFASQGEKNVFWQMCFDLVKLVLTTTWYTFHSQFYQQTEIGTMGEPVSSTTAEIYILMKKLRYPRHYTFQNFGTDLLMTEHFFHHINSLNQNINFAMVEESNGDLAVLDTLLKRINEKIFVFRKPIPTSQYLLYLQLSPPNEL